MPSLRLHYFGVPGLAEVSRLCMTVGEIPFDDVRYTSETINDFKPQTPFGQVPVLEVDGKKLAQSGAIERYCATLAGLRPEDAWLAAQCDQVVFLLKDMSDALTPTYYIKELDARIAARQEILKDKFPVKMQQLTKLLEDNGGKHFVGDRLTHADLGVYSMMSDLTSGRLDGIPTDLLKDWPVLKAFRSAIASLPLIKKYYEGHENRVSYLPDSA